MTNLLVKIIVCIIAGIGAGLGTGFAGMSAAAIIAPMLITFLKIDAYTAIGIALASDVLASAASSIMYAKNKNIDIKNGLVMMFFVLVFTVVGSYIASLVPLSIMGGFSTFMTALLGVKFIIKPVNTTKEKMNEKSLKTRLIQSSFAGMFVGFICGFIGAGGGMMMLIILTMLLNYELKTAVGTSVFIMSFTALTGAVSHFYIGGLKEITCLIICIISTLIFALIASKIANKVNPKVLNRIVGILLLTLGIVIFIVNFIN